MQKINIATGAFLALCLFACNSQPKVIEAETSESQNNTPIFQDVAPGNAGGDAMAAPNANQPSVHNIVAQEVLNTDKYSYIRVKEGAEEHWIAIAKRDIKIGAPYVYTGGLLKQNFMSREFNRVFDKVYLVSDFREAGEANPAGNAGVNIPTSTAPLEAPHDLKPAQGAIRIADLVANLAKYEGKVVKVTGKCVKLNPMIMGRNWVHLQDGSGKNLDLTVTTAEIVSLGAIVTLEGTLALKKDFGAGYKYDYIMENAVIK